MPTLFTAVEQRRTWLCQHRKRPSIIQLSFLISNSSEGTVLPGRAPGRPGEHGDRQEERVGHVSQGQGKENRECLGMSYVTESLSWPRRQFWTQSPSDMESPSSALPRQAARISRHRAVRMSAARLPVSHSGAKLSQHRPDVVSLYSCFLNTSKVFKHTFL